MILWQFRRALPESREKQALHKRRENFADLLTPYVVAGPLLAVVARAGAGNRTEVAARVGTSLFVQGHGVHLSANSISYARGDAAPAWLWDEVVGHVLWFIGLTMLTVALASAVRPLPLPSGPAAVALALAVGGTWAANVVEAGQVPLGAALAPGWSGMASGPGTVRRAGCWWSRSRSASQSCCVGAVAERVPAAKRARLAVTPRAGARRVPPSCATAHTISR